MEQKHDKPRGCNSLESQVDRVGMRIPEFSPEDPQVWFLIMESNFKTAGMAVDSTKHAYVAGAHLHRRDPWYNRWPTGRTRDLIKSELIKRPSPPQEHKTRQLLEHEKIGKPSQFLRRPRNMVGDELLRSIWLSRLPISLQPHLVTRTNDPLDQLAYAADIIMDTARTTSLWVETVRRLGLHDAEQDKDQMTALEARVGSLEAIGESEVIRMRNDIRVHVLVCSLVHGTVTRRVAYAGITGDSDPRQDAVNRLAPLNSQRKTRRSIVNGGERFRPSVVSFWLTGERGFVFWLRTFGRERDGRAHIWHGNHDVKSRTARLHGDSWSRMCRNRSSV